MLAFIGFLVFAGTSGDIFLGLPGVPAGWHSLGYATDAVGGWYRIGYLGLIIPVD